LNPYAAGGKARKLFEKNAAPVLHVAGMDVTVVEVSYVYVSVKYVSSVKIARPRNSCELYS
jgi:hypothetical protein